MDKIIPFPKKETPTWSHVCPGIGLITSPITNGTCKCGATKDDKQDGAAKAKKKTEVIEHEKVELTLEDESTVLVPAENKQISTEAVTPMMMMQMAIREGSDVATMERLWALNEKVEAANAKKAYDLAMSEFKKDLPKIFKDKHVSFGNTEYDHASLGNVVEKIASRLGEHGLSHHWDVEQKEKIKVTCILTHSQGHCEVVSLESAADTSGSIKGIQAIASTISYLQRYTLLSATGLATQDMDDDGQKAEPVELISEEQVNYLHSLITDNDLDMDKFKALLKAELGCENFTEIQIGSFASVERRIKSAIRAKGAQQ